MKLRGIEFGPCWDGAGVRGWMDERYWYHRLPLMRDWLKMEGSTLVSKTTTLPARIPPNGGNMPISPTAPWGPLERFPKSIWFGILSGRTVNSVGLSGPGAEVLLFRGLLDARDDGKPFQISFMSAAATPEERLNEFQQFVRLLLQYVIVFRKFGLQINISCPNAGIDPAHLTHQAIAMLDAATPLTNVGIPIILKLNVLVPTEAVKEMAAHPNCDALCVSNTLPFGMFPKHVAWKGIFPKGSPVRRRNETYGDGGYSGPELLVLVANFISRTKSVGVTIPWNAGGGIRHPRDVEYLVERAMLTPKVDSVFFASAAMVRPWNVPGIIRTAHDLLG